MADRVKWSLPLVFSLMCILACVRGNVRSKVRCSERWMEVDIARSSPNVKIYLQQLKDYPEEACKARMTDGLASFRLSLLEEDMLRCGITRVVNKLTGQKVYYHRIIVEEPLDSSRHTFTVKCLITEVLLTPEFSVVGSEDNERKNASGNGMMESGNVASYDHWNHSAIRRRSVLPAGFQEPDVIDIGGEISGSAPVPILGIGVRQGGNLITGELNVSPGTPLQMEIFLDSDSAPIYGLLLTYMQVTDTKFQEETIIINGCSVDPYLFENFNTVDGDFLTAKFRAFKFPESNYVQFRGTVNVCLDKCQGIECSNGQIGFGRKRRAIGGSSTDKNKVFEVTMSTFIRVDFGKDTPMDEVLSELYIRRGTRIRAKTRAVMAETLDERHSTATTAATASVTVPASIEERAFIAEEAKDQFKYRLDQTELQAATFPSSSSRHLRPSVIFATVVSFIACFYWQYILVLVCK